MIRKAIILVLTLASLWTLLGWARSYAPKGAAWHTHRAALAGGTMILGRRRSGPAGRFPKPCLQHLYQGATRFHFGGVFVDRSSRPPCVRKGRATRPGIANAVANILYRNLALVSAVRVTPTISCLIPVLPCLHWITPIGALEFQGNDVLVTIESALGNPGYRDIVDFPIVRQGATARTHANIADEAAAVNVGVELITVENLFGDLQEWPTRK